MEIRSRLKSSVKRQRLSFPNTKRNFWKPARRQLVALVNEARQAAQEEQKEAIAKARAEMEKALAELKKQLEKEKEEARKVLRQTANLLAVLIAEKLVGRKFEEERV